jgi:hypothetical protein
VRGEEIVKSEHGSSALVLKETRAVSPIGVRPERDMVETNGGDELPATGDALVQKRDALHACNLEAFAAAQVLAHQHIVSPQHIRLGF